MPEHDGSNGNSRPADASPAGNEPARKSKPKKESRLKRHYRLAREIYAEPRSVPDRLRTALVSVWVARGAGFYGLGWIIAFIMLEVNLFTDEWQQSAGVSDFLGGQILEYLLRVGFMSFVNTFLAAIWPVLLLDWLAEFGFVVLIGGYFAFEKLLRPVVEARFPELREARQAAEAKKQKKGERKQRKRGPKIDSTRK